MNIVLKKEFVEYNSKAGQIFMRRDRMTTKRILQTLGTVSSFVLAFITLNVARNFWDIKGFELLDVLKQYEVFILMPITVIIMISTGLSYFDSRIEHGGLTWFLYVCLGISLVVLAPISFTIAVLKVQFGEYWWGMLLGSLVLFYFISQQKETQN
jgi:hypothetical protein